MIVVGDHLDEAFPRRSIGRGGPVLWPTRSPDLKIWFYGNNISVCYSCKLLREFALRINQNTNKFDPKVGVLENLWHKNVVDRFLLSNGRREVFLFVHLCSLGLFCLF